MHRGVTNSLTAAVVVVVVGLAVTGCTAAAPPAPSSPPSPPPSVQTSTVTMPSRSVPAPTGLTQQQLYEKAVVQYRAFYKELIALDAVGGAPTLPGMMRQYVMDPALGAVEQMFSDMYYSGDRPVGTPYYELQRVALYDKQNPPAGTVVAIKTCELAQGAPTVSRDGTVVQDGSPVIKNRSAYFKFDTTDGRLKAFIINDATVETCPFS